MTDTQDAHAVADVILILRQAEAWTRAMATAFGAVDDAGAASAAFHSDQMAQRLARAIDQLTNLRLMERAQDDWGV